MDIFINCNNEQTSIRLPVLPSSFTIGSSQNNTSVYIHDLGEINLKGNRGLYSINFESFFPADDYDFCRCRPKSPYDYYVNNLKVMFEQNLTVHLVITETDINMYCTIESFSYGEKERNGDVSYSITFKEYRALDSAFNYTRVLKAAAKNVAYFWKSGDTWQALAKRYLGDSSKWESLRSNNSGVIARAIRESKEPDEKKALIGYEVIIT